MGSSRNVPHATAGVALIETGSGTEADLLQALDDLLPADQRWRHRHGSPGHGRDRPTGIGAAVRHGAGACQLLLGTWQSICLVDTIGTTPPARSGSRFCLADQLAGVEMVRGGSLSTASP